MQISEVQVVPIKPNNGLVGFASCVIDGNLYVGSIGIFTRLQGGYRLTYPTKKTPSGNVGVVYPINKETSHAIESVILAKFEEVTNQYVRHDSPDTQ
ncbi:MAG: hypothetical protein A3J60_02180 [Candidatus Pacebacteria bacterium RIFCSPHIGHO2_02_FULL_46_9]|nr:MAG: hypothetical protein A3J60_02180 [Candidatus Pacebacteria bacterium RIFCSPHIGHO2_02_FULL_46_9]